MKSAGTSKAVAIRGFRHFHFSASIGGQADCHLSKIRNETEKCKKLAILCKKYPTRLTIFPITLQPRSDMLPSVVELPHTSIHHKPSKRT